MTSFATTDRAPAPAQHSASARSDALPSRSRFRLARAYAVTMRVLASYLWLRAWRPVIGGPAYEARLVETHRGTARLVQRRIIQLNGLFIKVGQLISALTNFLPEEFRKELETLQDRVPARPTEQVLATLRSEYGRSPDEVFASFDPEPVASASLAQVHVATLRDGRQVAVKVQHADIEEIARLDLRAIRRILAMVQTFVRMRGLEAYHAEVSQMIYEELDFLREADNIERIAANFAGNEMVRFPAVLREMSTRRVLVTELIDGIKVTDLAALDAAGIERPAVARRILTAYCQMIFVDGVYHADPHPGNIFVQRDGGVVFLDFGAVGVLSPKMKAGIPLFFEGVLRRDRSKITAAMRDMGFVAHSGDPGDVAERVIDYFQRRFLDQVTIDSFKLSDIKVDMRTKLEAMADLRRLDVSFRQLTETFQVPKDWVLLERTILLGYGLYATLDPVMNPMRTIRPYLEEFVLGKDRDWVALARDGIRDVALSALTIPDGLHRLLSKANRGELEIRVPEIEAGFRLLYAAVHQVIYGGLAIAAAAIAVQALGRGEPWFARAAGALSAVFLVALAFSLVSAKRWR